MNSAKRNSMTGSIMLLIAAFIWGTAFVAQSQGMEYIGPFTFNTVRNYIASIVLIPLVFIMRRIQPADSYQQQNRGSHKDTIIAGICCGSMLFFASSFQQIGLK